VFIPIYQRGDLWLDGIIGGKGVVGQFVAMPLETGYTVEATSRGGRMREACKALSTTRNRGGSPKRNLPGHSEKMSTSVAAHRQIFAGPMSQAAGGKMNQKIYPDSYGIDSWDAQSSALRPIDEALAWS
jgi:hypothetical protein